MKRRPKRPLPKDTANSPAAVADAILPPEVWLTGISHLSPMVRRRVLGAHHKTRARSLPAVFLNAG